MVRDKIRIRFRKGGDLRLISHHDLMRCFERMLRRAALPFHSTEGFNPKPRMVFAMPLPLGVIGCEEVVELELDDELAPNEVCRRLAEQAPAGMEIFSARRIDGRETAHVRSVTYWIAVPPQQTDGLAERVTSLLAAPECWVERSRPQPRRMDIRPYLRDLRVLPGGLEMDLWVTPNGTARPEEILDLLGLADVLEAGAVFERTALELIEERSP
jgi:radical SAM-linked protein